MTLFAVADTAAVPYVVVSRGPPFWAFTPILFIAKRNGDLAAAIIFYGFT